MSVNSLSFDALVERPLKAGHAAALSPQSITPARSRWLTPDGYFHLTMLGLALVLFFAAAVGLQLTQTLVRVEQFLPTLLGVVILLAGARLCYLRRMPKVANALMLVAWANAFSRLCAVLIFISVRLRAPLHDSLLARLDAALGVEVPAVLRVMDAFPLLRQVLDFCYFTLIPLMALALVLLPLRGKMQAAKEFAVANVLAVVICLPVFATFQAMGPWVIYGYPASALQDDFMRTFAAIRSEDWYVIDLTYEAGLICFPSFHTVLAVLAAAALWPIAYLRWPAALLGALIVLSTVTTGWHYLSDVIAGLVVAGVVRALAMGYSRLEARLTRPAPGLAGE